MTAHLTFLFYSLSLSAGLLAVSSLFMLFLQFRLDIIKRIFQLWLAMLFTLIVVIVNFYILNIMNFRRDWYMLLMISLGNGSSVLTLVLVRFTIKELTSKEPHKLELAGLFLLIVSYLWVLSLIIMMDKALYSRLNLIQQISALYYLFYLLYQTILVVLVRNRLKKIETGNFGWAEILILIFIPSLLLILLDLGFAYSNSLPVLHSYPAVFALWSILAIAYSFYFISMRSSDQKPIELNEAIINKYSLTPRENDVLELLISGIKIETIADRLCIAFKTAEKHVYNIYKKTGVHNRVELITLISRNQSNK